MSFGVNLTNIKEIQGALKEISDELKMELIDEINASALTIQSNAKKLAPVDLGTLRNSIALNISDNRLTYEVESNAKYAPYIEFGTGGLVDIPTGYEDLAILYKGKGIKQVNIKPQPFLIPSFETEVPKLIKRLKNIFNA